MLLLRALSGTEGEFEGENVAMLSLRWGRRRMTGSAFARYELRGTFRIAVEFKIVSLVTAVAVHARQYALSHCQLMSLVSPSCFCSNLRRTNIGDSN